MGARRPPYHFFDLVFRDREVDGWSAGDDALGEALGVAGAFFFTGALTGVAFSGAAGLAGAAFASTGFSSTVGLTTFFSDVGFSAIGDVFSTTTMESITTHVTAWKSRYLPAFLTGFALGVAFGLGAAFGVSNFSAVFATLAGTSSTGFPTRFRPLAETGVALLVEGIGSDALDVDGRGVAAWNRFRSEHFAP